MKRGFSIGDNAASAARRNHELGTAHRFTPTTGRDAGAKGLERRWGSERRQTARATPDRRGSALTARG